MPLSHPVDDVSLIELLNGLLDDAHREELLAHVRKCPECEARMQSLARERELLRAARIPVIEEQQLVFRPRRKWRRIAPVGAAIAAAITIAFLAMTANRHNLEEDQYWIPVAGEVRTVLRAEGSDGAELEGALRAYQERDARSAVEELEQYTVPQNATAQSLHDIFLASAQLNAGNPEQALKSLEPLFYASLPQPWRDRAQWIQYLSLRRLDRRVEAQAVLMHLQGSAGDIGERARRELAKASRDRPSG